MNKWLPIIVATLLFAVGAFPAAASEWKLFEKSDLNQNGQQWSVQLLESSTFTSLPGSGSLISNPIVRFEEKMIPLTMSQLKLSFIDIEQQADMSSSLSESGFAPRFSLNTGLQTLSLQGAESSTTLDSETEWSVSTIILFFGVNLDIGPTYLQGNTFTVRPPESGSFFLPSIQTGFLQDNLMDTNFNGFNAIAGYKLSDRVTFEAGYEYLKQSSKRSGNGDEAWGIYAQAILNIAPGVQVIPGIGQVDFDKSKPKTATADNFYAGAKWEINF